MDNDKTSMEIARDMARSSIYDDAKYVGQYNGFNVYQPTCNRSERPCIGFTQFILAKNGKFDWIADEKTSRAVMRAIYPDE